MAAAICTMLVAFCADCLSIFLEIRPASKLPARDACFPPKLDFRRLSTVRYFILGSLLSLVHPLDVLKIKLELPCTRGATGYWRQATVVSARGIP